MRAQEASIDEVPPEVRAAALAAYDTKALADQVLSLRADRSVSQSDGPAVRQLFFGDDDVHIELIVTPAADASLQIEVRRAAPAPATIELCHADGDLRLVQPAELPVVFPDISHGLVTAIATAPSMPAATIRRRTAWVRL